MSKFCLSLENVPSTLDNISLEKFCLKFGKVIRVYNGNNELSNRFVLFETSNDIARAVVRINQDKQFGIKAFLINTIPPNIQDDLAIDELNKPVYKRDIKYKMLRNGQNIEVLVMDNSLASVGFISCILPKDAPFLDDLYEEIDEYMDKNMWPYRPRTNEICIVHYEDEWYRGECLEAVDDEYTFFLRIDVGDICKVHKNNIQKYPRGLNQPCITSCCMIKGLPDDLSEMAVARICELIPFSKRLIVDKVITRSLDNEETNILFLPKLIETLKSEKLI